MHFAKTDLSGDALTKKVDANVKNWLKRYKNNDGKVDVKEYFTKKQEQEQKKEQEQREINKAKI